METDWRERLITPKKPFKGEVIEIGKMLSKEYFRIYLEDNNNKNLEVLEDDIIIMGFKEFEDTYVMLLALPKLPDYYCEMTFSISNKKLLQTNMFRKVIL